MLSCVNTVVASPRPGVHDFLLTMSFDSGENRYSPAITLAVIRLSIQLMKMDDGRNASKYMGHDMA